jgi:hypothetical protein
MSLLPTLLTAPCPWCGCRNLAPVGTPLRELDRWLETRCRSCGGGMRGRAPWRSFVAFVCGFGLLSDLTLALALEGRFAWSTPGQLAWLAGYAALGLGLTVALAAFLIASTSVRRGREPEARETA